MFQNKKDTLQYKNNHNISSNFPSHIKQKDHKDQQKKYASNNLQQPSNNPIKNEIKDKKRIHQINENSKNNDTIKHCQCCQFFKPNKQKQWHEKMIKQIIFIEDDFDTYLQLQEKQHQENNRMNQNQEIKNGSYFSKGELEALNKQIPKFQNCSSQQSKINEMYQQQNHLGSNNIHSEEQDYFPKKKNYFMNTTHKRTSSYDSYAAVQSKSQLEQISEEREEQESQLTFQNKYITHANSSQNLRSENNNIISSFRNSIENIQSQSNDKNNRKSSPSIDNERSIGSLYFYQNQTNFQGSQQNTPQISILAQSVGSSSSCLPQQSQYIIDSHQNQSEQASSQQLSLHEMQIINDSQNWQGSKKRNQHFRSQSCPFSVPYFKYNQKQSNYNEENQQNIRVMTIHEEEPYHNYVHNNSNNYNCNSNNSTRNKYRQQQSYRQIQQFRSNSVENSNSILNQNTSYTPNSITEEKEFKKDQYTHSFLLPSTNTAFCFESTFIPTQNLQADENQYLQESFHSQIYDGDNKDQLSVRKEYNNIIITSNKPSLENKLEKEHEYESKAIKLKSLAQKQSQQIPINPQRYRATSLINELQNNSNSYSLNLVKSFNQLDTDQGFISFRNENSIINSSQQEEELIENMNIRSSHNSIEVDFKLKIRENISAIKNRQIYIKHQRITTMKNNMFKDSDKEIFNFISIAANRSFINNIRKQSNITNSLTQNGGSSSGKKLPSQLSYQGSANSQSQSSTLSTTQLISLPFNRVSAYRNKNFWSYDISNGCEKNKSFLSNDNTQLLKKGEEDNLRRVIEDGFKNNYQQKQRSLSQKLDHLADNNLSNKISDSNQSITQPINFIQKPNSLLTVENSNLQQPLILPSQTYNNIVIPFSSAPISLQVLNNITHQQQKTGGIQQTQDNTQIKTSALSQSQQNLGNSQNTFYTFNNSTNEIQTPSNTFTHINPSNNMVTSFNNNTNFDSLNNNSTQNINRNINKNNRNNVNNNEMNMSIINNNSQSVNIKSNPIKNLINNSSSIPSSNLKSLNTPSNSNILLNNQNEINKQQTNNLHHQNQVQNINNSYLSINNSSHNQHFLLNRISEECESPANTTYKQQQEYLNYESEHYLTGSKSQYHKKQYQITSGESIYAKKMKHDDKQDLKLPVFDHQPHFGNPEKQSSQITDPDPLQMDKMNDQQQLEEKQQGQQQQITQQTNATMFNLLNHTIANPNNLNQSQQLNPSANTSWFESSRSYEIFMLEENKAKNFQDNQLLSLQKQKNAPSSHMSSQKSLLINNLEGNENQANSENNFGYQQNLATNNNINMLGIQQMNNRSGDNTPNDRIGQKNLNKLSVIPCTITADTFNEYINPFMDSNNNYTNFKNTLQTQAKQSQIYKQKDNLEQIVNTNTERTEKFDSIIQNLTKDLNQQAIAQDFYFALPSNNQILNLDLNLHEINNTNNLQNNTNNLNGYQNKNKQSDNTLRYSNNSNKQNDNKNQQGITSTNHNQQYMSINNEYGNNSQKISSENTESMNLNIQNFPMNKDSNNNNLQTNINQEFQNSFNHANSINQYNNHNSLIQNLHNINSNFANSHRSSTSTSNSNQNFMEIQGIASVERMSEASQSIEIFIERRQNNHSLLIQALRKQLQESKPQVLAEIENHINSHPNQCFILVLQENLLQQTVLKGVYRVQNQNQAKKSYLIENIPSVIGLQDIEEFLRIDRDEYYFECVDSPDSFRKIEAVILKSPTF